MSKRPRLCATAGIVLAISAIGLWWLWHSPGPAEPVYQGRRLSVWFADHLWAPPGPVRSKTEADIRQMGTNAIPTLLKMIRAKDPPAAVRKMLELASKQHLVKIDRQSARRRHDAAAYGFEILGTNAACATPGLIAICGDQRYAAAQEYAAKALGDIGPAAQAAIPVLLQNFAHTNADVRFRAVTAILQIGGDPKIIVPRLMGVLRDSKPEVRFNAVAALRRFGRDATPAIPELLTVRNDPFIKNEVENILWNFVPEKLATPLVVEDFTPMVTNGVTVEALSREQVGKLYTLIPQGKQLRCVSYQSVGDQPLYLYRGVTQSSSKDHFLGRFEVAIPSPATNFNIEVVYIVDDQQIRLCARDYTTQQFLELRRVKAESEPAR